MRAAHRIRPGQGRSAAIAVRRPVLDADIDLCRGHLATGRAHMARLATRMPTPRPTVPTRRGRRSSTISSRNIASSVACALTTATSPATTGWSARTGSVATRARGSAGGGMDMASVWHSPAHRPTPLGTCQVVRLSSAAGYVNSYSESSPASSLETNQALGGTSAKLVSSLMFCPSQCHRSRQNR